MSQVSELRGAVLGKGYRLDRRADDKDENQFEATHERLPGHFTVRLFPVEMLTQPEASSRIQRGARVASLVRDPHAVQTLDFSVSGEMPAFVVMERTPGRTLDAIVAEDGMLPLPRAIDLIESIAIAIGAGHQIGLVHGDLRPAHVILPMSGQPLTKLSGFGWAKELRAASRVPMPSGYLAPEQNFGKVLTIDERVDQFGLAVLAYEIIAGCLPFSEESADLADRLGRRRIPPAIADLVSGVPRQLDEVLRRALSFTPSERFGGVPELVSELRTAVTGGSRSRVPTPATPRPVLPGATPALKPDSDITDELVIGAWAPGQDSHDSHDSHASHASHDSHDSHASQHSDGGPHRDGDGARVPRVNSTGAKADADDDAMLVLGPASGPVATDDEKTQIRRSPFLTYEDMAAQAPPDRPHGTPRRGMPHGRPGVDEESLGPPIVLTPPDRTGPVRELSVSVRTKIRSLWNEAVDHRKWTLPTAIGLGVLLIIGVVIGITSGSNDAPSASDGVRPRRTRQSPSALVPNRGAQARAPGAEVRAPAGLPAATPTTGSGQATGILAQPPSPAPRAPIVARIEPLAAVEKPPETITPPESKKVFASPRVSTNNARGAGHRATARTPAGAASRPSSASSTLASLPATAPGSRPAPSGGPSDCTLRIASKPWAQIWIDGKNTGQRTPVDNLKVACGVRRLQLRRPDKGLEQMEMLKVVPGKPYQGNYQLQ